MNGLTHRLAAALGCMVESANAPGTTGDQLDLDTASAEKVLAEYDAACRGGDEGNYHGREGG